jgi:spore germination cell wall hydrolase CwlJ-like protein
MIDQTEVAWKTKMLFSKKDQEPHAHESGTADFSPYQGEGTASGYSKKRGAIAAIVAIVCAIAGVTAWANLSTIAPVRQTTALIDKRAAPVIDQISGEPAVFQFRPVGADAAIEMNAAIPTFNGDLPPAARFNGVWTTSQDQTRALDCLTAAIYYEAATESAQGQRAVAQVVINRVRDPNYPKSICGVVFQGSQRKTGCQFSFTCDGSLARQPSAPLWQRLRALAWAAMNGQVEPSVGNATHYHTIWVVPYWQSGLQKLGVVGSHIFYTWLGGAARSARTGSDQILAEQVPLPSVEQATPLPPLGGLPPMPAPNDPGFSRLANGSLPPGSVSPGLGTVGMGSGLQPPAAAPDGSETVSAPQPIPESPIAADRSKGQLNADAERGSLIR